MASHHTAPSFILSLGRGRNGPSPFRVRATHAFSLVELSIVLVILGLLVGGILAGQSLIRASELRTVSADVSRYNQAMLAFKDKYFALAGDITNATAFWGTAASCPGTYTTPSSDNTTCNGDGNGQVTSIETWRTWQQLTAAGLTQAINRTLLWWSCLQEASAAEWRTWGAGPLHHLTRVLDG